MATTLEGLLSGMETGGPLPPQGGGDPFAASPERMARDQASMRDLTYEYDLQRAAASGNPQAQAILARRKAMQDQQQMSLQQALQQQKLAAGQQELDAGGKTIPGMPFNLRQLTSLVTGVGKLDEEAQQNLLSRLIPGLARGRTKEQRIAAETTARTKATEEAQQGLRPPKVAAGGGIVDKETGELYEPTAFTQAEVNASGNRLKTIGVQDRQNITYIENTVLPSMEQLKALVPKLAVKAAGENLRNWIKIEARKGVGMDPDAKQYVNLRTKIALEEAKVITGGSRSVTTIFEQLEGTTLPHLRETLDVQLRTLESDQWEFENRVRGIKGQKPIGFDVWQTQNKSPTQGGGGKPLTPEKAQEFKRRSGNNRAKAEAMARAEGYTF